MTNQKLFDMQEAIREEGLDGWLFCNFQHRDKLADTILGIPSDATNSRLWVYVVPARGVPLILVHAIEGGILDGLPGQKTCYSGRTALRDALTILLVQKGHRWGAHISDTITAISYLDAGNAALFREVGFLLVSAAGLIQRFQGLLNAEQRQSHERAVEALSRIVDRAWEWVRGAYTDHRSFREGELREFIQEAMKSEGLVSNHPPLVAAGVHSGDPHYDFSGPGELIMPGDLIQLDLWAKEASPGTIYGDISWMGIFGPTPTEEQRRIFADLVEAREQAYRHIEQALHGGRRPSGAEVDVVCRDFLFQRGYGEAVKHRTGHGIDTECHGSGVNIDSVEFPDFRLLLDGSCFSLEPGLYFPAFGFRTEIDVSIVAGQPLVSGQHHPRQYQLLYC